MEIPEAMLETQQRQMLDEFAQRITSQGLSFDQYMQFTGATKDALLEQVKPNALRKIQARLVLEAVVKAENIKASDEDYQKELETMAEVYQMTVDEIKETLSKNDKAKEQIMEDLAINKAVEFIVDNAKAEAKRLPRRQLTRKNQQTKQRLRRSPLLRRQLPRKQLMIKLPRRSLQLRRQPRKQNNSNERRYNNELSTLCH